MNIPTEPIPENLKKLFNRPFVDKKTFDENPPKMGKTCETCSITYEVLLDEDWKKKCKKCYFKHSVIMLKKKELLSLKNSCLF